MFPIFLVPTNIYLLRHIPTQFSIVTVNYTKRELTILIVQTTYSVFNNIMELIHAEQTNCLKYLMKYHTASLLPRHRILHSNCYLPQIVFITLLRNEQKLSIQTNYGNQCISDSINIRNVDNVIVEYNIRKYDISCGI